MSTSRGIMQPRPERRRAVDLSGKRFGRAMAFSLAGHVLFFLLCFGMPHWVKGPPKAPSMINVQLVSLESPAMAAAAPSSAPAPAPAPTPPAPFPEPVAVQAKKPEKTVPVGPKAVKKKRSLKKKTYQAEKIVRSALKKVEKRVETAKPDPIQQALDNIQARLRNTAPPARQTSRGEGGAAGTAGVRGGQPASDLKQAYQVEVAFFIQSNWAFSEQLAGGEKNLQNEVAFKILRNGEISDIWFDRRSGNRHLDDSAYKAILKSSPLPPIPEGIREPYITLGLRFGPGGVN